MAYDVFISYSSHDQKVANAVCSYLEQAKVRCWIAPRDIQPGQSYGAAIIDGLNACDVLVLLFSGKANASPHVNREVERAVSKGAVIVPFRIEDVVPSESMEFFISSEHWLDAINPPLEQHLGKLVDTVCKLVEVAEKRSPEEKSAVPAIEASAAKEFEELAPDEWLSGPRRPKKGFLGFLQNLLSEK